MRSTYKLDFLFSNFGFGVLHSQKCYVMFQYNAIKDRATDPVSVAFIDQVALFSYFNRLFELLGPDFAPYGS